MMVFFYVKIDNATKIVNCEWIEFLPFDIVTK